MTSMNCCGGAARLEEARSESRSAGRLRVVSLARAGEAFDVVDVVDAAAVPEVVLSGMISMSGVPWVSAKRTWRGGARLTFETSQSTRAANSVGFKLGGRPSPCVGVPGVVDCALGPDVVVAGGGTDDVGAIGSPPSSSSRVGAGEPAGLSVSSSGMGPKSS
jgi:hypothetical protein